MLFDSAKLLKRAFGILGVVVIHRSLLSAKLDRLKIEEVSR